MTARTIVNYVWSGHIAAAAGSTFVGEPHPLCQPATRAIPVDLFQAVVFIYVDVSAAAGVDFDQELYFHVGQGVPGTTAAAIHTPFTPYIGHKLLSSPFVGSNAVIPVGDRVAIGNTLFLAYELGGAPSTGAYFCVTISGTPIKQ